MKFARCSICGAKFRKKKFNHKTCSYECNHENKRLWRIEYRKTKDPNETKEHSMPPGEKFVKYALATMALLKIYGQALPCVVKCAELAELNRKNYLYRGGRWAVESV